MQLIEYAGCAGEDEAAISKSKPSIVLISGKRAPLTLAAMALLRRLDVSPHGLTQGELQVQVARVA